MVQDCMQESSSNIDLCRSVMRLAASTLPESSKKKKKKKKKTLFKTKKTEAGVIPATICKELNKPKTGTSAERHWSESAFSEPGQEVTGVLTHTKTWQHITPTLTHLHWLPIESRITYEILLLTSKSLHAPGPTVPLRPPPSIHPTPKPAVLRRSRPALHFPPPDSVPSETEPLVLQPQPSGTPSLQIDNCSSGNHDPRATTIQGNLQAEKAFREEAKLVSIHGI
ncbi:uncharacterized protein LOC114570204 [Perca flavescens]|uniref:uncharacterized protein LOC114570204 n=1 Tax=Perca flavescens TaxID=8167 RepID=UPI00106EAC52|nr:uncharacterized protein LOC114570204 [Perca flavescens]